MPSSQMTGISSGHIHRESLAGRLSPGRVKISTVPANVRDAKQVRSPVHTVALPDSMMLGLHRLLFPSLPATVEPLVQYTACEILARGGWAYSTVLCRPAPRGRVPRKYQLSSSCQRNLLSSLTASALIKQLRFVEKRKNIRSSARE